VTDVPEGEFEKPKPRRQAMSVHDFRKIVSARHKALAAQKPADAKLAWTEEDPGVKLLMESYGADLQSCIDFVGWLREEVPPGREILVDQRVIGSGNKGSALERIHVTTDARTGDEKYIDTVPGSIPPRPVKPPAKPR
jgi:hypothetical protein